MSMHFKIEQLSPAMRAQVEDKLAPKPKPAAMVQAPEVAPKPLKMRNIPTEMDGIRFDSRKEAARYLILREQERRGEIKNLLVHGRIPLEVNGIFICHFEVDFMFERDGKLRAEDVKGRKCGSAWTAYLTKANLFHALHGTMVLTV